MICSRNVSASTQFARVGHPPTASRLRKSPVQATTRHPDRSDGSLARRPVPRDAPPRSGGISPSPTSSACPYASGRVPAKTLSRSANARRRVGGWPNLGARDVLRVPCPRLVGAGPLGSLGHSVGEFRTNGAESWVREAASSQQAGGPTSARERFCGCPVPGLWGQGLWALQGIRLARFGPMTQNRGSEKLQAPNTQKSTAARVQRRVQQVSVHLPDKLQRDFLRANRFALAMVSATPK